MHYRQLGSTGVKVSVVGVGCNRIGKTVDEAGTQAIVHRALEAGINLFDTADVYGTQPGASEELLGRTLVGLRDQVVLATKGGMPVGPGPNHLGASRYHFVSAVEASLRRLKTDHIDLYYVHQWDPSTPLPETLRALDDLVRAGKVRYIGGSNFSAWQLCHANDLAEMYRWSAFVVTQEHYHLFRRDVERDLVPYLRYAHIGLIPYYPLAGGFLTGKYHRGQTVTGSRAAYVQPYLTEANLNMLDRLRTFAETRGHTVGELAIAWLIARPQVCSVISGATNADQVGDNARSAGWILTAEEIDEIHRLLEPKPRA